MANPVINEILRQGRGKPRKHVLAALTTGRVESGFRNLPGGDADSQGWRQERASLYKDPQNLQASVKRFYNETAQHDRGQSAGELAADVQRPAAQYRGRYAQHLSEAKQILAGRGVQTGGGGGGGGGRTITSSTPGTDNRVARAQLVQAFLSDKGADPVNFALQARALKDVPGVTSTRRVRGVRATRATAPAGGNAQIRELFWNGPGATNIDNGKTVGKGFVSGHTDHVHLAADRATMQRAAALAKSLGLNVGEYGKGISSGHATGSFHYQPYGAMDVSGDVNKMAQFAKRVGRGRL